MKEESISLLEGIPDSIIEHRKSTMQLFSQEGAFPELNQHFEKLFHEWNANHFNTKLKIPYIRMVVPSNPRRWGEYSPVSSEGGQAEIRIRPSLLWGTHPQVEAGGEYRAGRLLIVDDVLLHEMIHQFQHEVLDKRETSYRGHGPNFRNRCNLIGKDLGLPEVFTKDKKDLPQCRYWPHCVRPVEYYQGAVEEDFYKEESKLEPHTDDTVLIRLEDTINKYLDNYPDDFDFNNIAQKLDILTKRYRS